MGWANRRTLTGAAIPRDPPALEVEPPDFEPPAAGVVVGAGGVRACRPADAGALGWGPVGGVSMSLVTFPDVGCCCSRGAG